MNRMTKSLVKFMVLVGAVGISLAAPKEKEITIEVGAGKEECFFETVKENEILEIDYQVIDGGPNNEMEIKFKLFDPTGVPVAVDFQKSENTHRQTAHMNGDYKICFDNSVRGFSSKIIYFELLVERDSDDDDEDWRNILRDEDETYGIKAEDLENAIRSIREKISRSRHFQDQIKNHEFRDRSIAEHNFERVNFWSTLQIIIMMVAGLTQVILVRSLFDEKSALHSMWKK